ncbi:MAG: dihydroorotase [Lachnospiraceae bacterium]|nr:dihydroorotase [Lachnospiraceae bacterium]
MLLIKNGLVIDPSQDLCEKKDILVKDGKIAQVKSEILSEAECNTIDAAGCIVAPGLVDVHVHFRDPGFTYKEDIESGARAAVKGGFTSVVLMANTKPAVDNKETITYVIEKGKTVDLNVYTCATVTKAMAGRELTDMDQLSSCGAAGFTDDGIPIMDEALLEEAFRNGSRLHVPISLHEEDPSLIANNGINQGKASAHFGIGGSPREAEISLVARDLKIALKTGAILNIQHISAKESVQLVREAKRRAAQNGSGNIHAEATPHHFSLTEEAAIQYGTLAKMNPPLREEADRLAIIEGLRDGTIDIIATDHAPHSKEEKEKAITEAPSGIIGLETALALGITTLVEENGFSQMQLLQRMSTNPAKLYGLNAGTLAEGAPADIVIYDPKESRTAGNYRSKASNSPFTGRKLQGVVKYTIVCGNIVYRD